MLQKTSEISFHAVPSQSGYFIIIANKLGLSGCLARIILSLKGPEPPEA